MTTKSSQYEFVHNPQPPAPPPPTPEVCVRLATNQLGQQVYLTEPEDAVLDAVWTGVDSTATGVHQNFEYEQITDPPGTENDVYQQWIIMKEVIGTFDPGEDLTVA